MAPKTEVIEQLRARIAELEEEIERLRADNISFARNLKGKSATTGATYEHICDQLAAAQEEIANETAWQPLETAPKDGSWVLGWRQYATRPRLIQFDTDYEEWANEDGEHVYAITHWMPLPTPPKRSMEGCKK